MATEKFTAEQVIAAIEKGITPFGAAQELKCHPDTVRNYGDRYPTVKRALLSKRKELVDLAEMGLRRAILNGEAWAIPFCLRTLARDIYAERHEITGADGGAVDLNVIRVIDHENTGL